MRPPNREIHAPPFPAGLEWVNVAMLRMDQQLGRPVLIEFWDFCRPNSLRTLPYVKGWHDRYGPRGLRVVGVHASGFPASADPARVRAAVGRLGIEHAVVIDAEFEIWELYGNLGWPARYLFDGEGVLVEAHIGEGAYPETEEVIRELLGLEPGDPPPPSPPLRPEDDPRAMLAVQTEDVAGPYTGPYEAGGVWAVLDGRGTVRVNGDAVAVEHPGAYLLVEHPHHTRGELTLEPGPGITCHATVFTPGIVPADG